MGGRSVRGGGRWRGGGGGVVIRREGEEREHTVHLELRGGKEEIERDGRRDGRHFWGI